MKTHIMDRHLWKHTGGKKNPEHAQGDEAEAAVNPLTSTVLVLIKTRCRENDCREERNTQSDTHMHAHTYTHAFPGVTAFRTQQQLVATSGELTHAEKKMVNEKFKCLLNDAQTVHGDFFAFKSVYFKNF